MKFKPKIFFLVIFLILLFSKSSYPANFSDITSTNLPAISDFSLGAVAVDADKDGDFDIFVANNGQDRLLLNNSSGVFSDAYLPQDNDYSTGAAAGDVNGDSYDDIFVANFSVQNRMLINDGTGNFQDKANIWLPSDTSPSTSGAFGDIDGDGDLDLVVANSSSSKSDAIRILINDNKTKFVDETSTRLPVSNSAYTQKVILSDFDRDGDSDILAINSLGISNKLLLNDGTGKFTEDTSSIIPSDSDSSNSAAVAEIDGDGFVDYIFIANDGGQQNKLYIYTIRVLQNLKIKPLQIYRLTLTIALMLLLEI